MMSGLLKIIRPPIALWVEGVVISAKIRLEVVVV
jgi:hypothetical protein